MVLRRVVLAVAAMAMAAGCSPMSPSSVGHEGATQQKELQTGAHWDILADDTASRVAALMAEHGQPQASVFVEPLDPSMPFGRSFHQYLTARLLEKGLKVALERRGAFRIHTAVNPIPHRHRTVSAPPGTLALLGAGVWGLSLVDGSMGRKEGLVAGTVIYEVLQNSGAFGPFSEVHITVSVVRDKQLVARTNSTYYVDDAELFQYLATAPSPPVVVETPNWAMEPLAVREFNVMGD